MSAGHDATIAKWTRKKEKAEDDDKKANKGMKDAIVRAMEDQDTHKNIAQELLDARRGGTKSKHQEGFGDDGEVITGYQDDRPWTRD